MFFHPKRSPRPTAASTPKNTSVMDFDLAESKCHEQGLYFFLSGPLRRAPRGSELFSLELDGIAAGETGQVDQLAICGRVLLLAIIPYLSTMDLAIESTTGPGCEVDEPKGKDGQEKAADKCFFHESSYETPYLSLS